MANILDPNEDYNPKNGLRVIYTKLKEVIRVLNTAVTNIATNTFNIATNTQDIAALEIQAGSYKKYVALLTQTTVSTTSGVLVVGKTYNIATLLGADNFANVGYVSAGVNFVATGTTPTNWTNSTSVLNVTDSAPVATILENTLSGTPVWSYSSAGVYQLTLASEFTANKTWSIISSASDDNITMYLTKIARKSNNIIEVSTSNGAAQINGVLLETSITIEIYP